MSGSLALIADAGHMLTDAAAILMALVAMWIADREASIERTFGYQRAEVLAALINTFALWLIAGWILFEAYHRTFSEEVHVDGLPVLIVGFGGLLINIVAAWILHRSSEHSMNVEGAFQHVLADLLGSVGVIISAILILTLGMAARRPDHQRRHCVADRLEQPALDVHGTQHTAGRCPEAHRRVQTVQ